jgi:hypothetical protein
MAIEKTAKVTAKTQTAKKPVNNSYLFKTAGERKVFINDTKELAQKINTSYKSLINIFNSESAVDPTSVRILKKNGKPVIKDGKPYIAAAGIIHFQRPTLQDLNKIHKTGHKLEDLPTMHYKKQFTLIERQVSYAKKLAKKTDDKKLTDADLYVCFFAPKRMNQEVLYTAKSNPLSYKSNRPFDLNNDGEITKTEVGQWLKRKEVPETFYA